MENLELFPVVGLVKDPEKFRSEVERASTPNNTKLGVKWVDVTVRTFWCAICVLNQVAAARACETVEPRIPVRMKRVIHTKRGKVEEYYCYPHGREVKALDEPHMKKGKKK